MGATEIHDSLRLNALGGLAIISHGAPLTGTVARRRSLALIALVASAGEAGIPDERALSLLWPEFDSVRARNNLKQVVFALRQSVGRDAFLRNTGALRLDPSIFSVDRWEFERAIAARDSDHAVALYGGPFLAGFHIAGLAEFDQWVEAERERLAHAHLRALIGVALATEAAGDLPAAIEWWRECVAEDRLNEGNARRLIRALAVAGDTAGALQQARVYESLLAQELDVQPTASFQQLIHDIRGGVPLLANHEISGTHTATPPRAVPTLTLPTESQAAQLTATHDPPPSSPAAVLTVTTAISAGNPARPRRLNVWTTGER
jgi:DNA-binding SARP family transcriptional activator